MQRALGSTSGKTKKTSKSDEQQGRSSDGSSHALGAGQQQKNNEGLLHWAGEQPVRAGMGLQQRWQRGCASSARAWQAR